MRALVIALLLSAVSTAATAAPNLPATVLDPSIAVRNHEKSRPRVTDDEETLKNIPTAETPQQKRRARKACLEAVKDDNSSTDCK